MSNTVVSKAAHRTAPVVQTTDTGGRNIIFRVASSTSNSSFAVPSAWRNNIIRVLSTGCDTQIAFSLEGDAAPTLSYNAAVALTVTGSVSAGMTCLNGVPEEFFLQTNEVNVGGIGYTKKITSGSIISSAAGGFIEFLVNSGQGTIS